MHFYIETAQGRTAVLDGVSEEALRKSLQEASDNALARLTAYHDSLIARNAASTKDITQDPYMV